MAGVLIQDGEHLKGIACGQVSRQSGHPVRLGPHLHPALTPGPLGPLLRGGGIGGEHCSAGRGPQLPGGLLRRLTEHPSLHRRDVLRRQVHGLGIKDTGLGQSDPARLHRRQRGRQPSAQRPRITHPTRRGPC
jgi:hypothetical protein